jgi:hypothetical protein
VEGVGGDGPAAEALAPPRVSGDPAFYCQIEAAETAIWLTEVAPEGRNYYAGGRKMNESNDRLNRLMP